MEITGTGMTLPGYQAPPPATYYGPEFVPATPVVNQPESEAELLAKNLQLRDAKEKQALEWLVSYA